LSAHVIFSPGSMPKRGALKVAPERASQIKSTRQLLATPFGRHFQGAFLGAHDPELEPRAILLRHFMAIQPSVLCSSAPSLNH
jgi:hypothetical protein